MQIRKISRNSVVFPLKGKDRVVSGRDTVPLRGQLGQTPSSIVFCQEFPKGQHWAVWYGHCSFLKTAGPDTQGVRTRRTNRGQVKFKTRP